VRETRRWRHNDWHPRQAREGWLRAGWQVEAVDLTGETVTFVRGAG
jgi:hypothetical protein